MPLLTGTHCGCGTMISKADTGTHGYVWAVHGDLAVKPAGAQQRRVEDVGAVGGREDDDASIALKAVHLGQQLVDRLLALVIAAAHACTPARSPACRA